MRLPAGCGSVLGKVVLLTKILDDLKQSGRAWYQVLSSTLVGCWFEQILVDPCVFRLIVIGGVVAMMVVHVDDIKTAATEAVTEVVAAALNQRLYHKTSRGGSGGYNRDREKSTVEIPQTQFIWSALSRFGVSKSRPILAIRQVSEEETVVHVYRSVGRGGLDVDREPDEARYHEFS